MSVITDPDAPFVFWRARDTRTGLEQKFQTKGIPHDITKDAMAAWVSLFYRNLEYIEHAPWDPKEHAGVFFGVPKHNVKFHVPLADPRRPTPIRKSVFVSVRGYQTPAPIKRAPLSRRSLILP